jgi:hypothetical protein
MSSADSGHRALEDTFRRATDVFAFGMILFEIVAGGPAFPESLNQSVAIEGAAGDPGLAALLPSGTNHRLLEGRARRPAHARRNCGSVGGNGMESNRERGLRESGEVCVFQLPFWPQILWEHEHESSASS